MGANCKINTIAKLSIFDNTSAREMKYCSFDGREDVNIFGMFEMWGIISGTIPFEKVHHPGNKYSLRK